MKKSTLRHRIRFFILLPILIGSLVTALVAIAPIFIQYPSWIDKIMTDIVNDQGEVMMQVSKQVGELSSGFLQIPVYYVVLMGKLMQSYYEGDLLMSTDLQYLTNQDLLANLTNSAIVLSMNDAGMEKDYNKSMWSYGTIDDLYNLSSTPGMEILTTCVKFDSFMLPIVSSVATSKTENRITGFFYGFTETKFFYVSPSASYPYFNTTTPFDPTTRPWFKETMAATEQFLAIISSPDLQIDSNMTGQNACFGVWPGDTMELAVCIGFNITILDNKLMETSLTTDPGDSYSFVINSNGTVFSHPYYNRSTEKSIEMLEFNSDNSSEAISFSNTIGKYFTDGTRALAKYQKYGSKWLIAIQPVNVDMGTDQLYRRDLSAAVVMKESVLWDRVEALKDESNNVLIVESIIFFTFLVTMMILGWILTQKIVFSVVKPLDMLADILDRLMSRDLKIEIKEPKDKCSQEIRDLYQVFGKIRIAMRFGEPNLANNDAEMLINFSQALQLFEEFNNTKGMRVCCSKLGEVNRKNQRFKEAIDYFRRAYTQAEILLKQPEVSEEITGRKVDVLKMCANELAEAIMESPDEGDDRWVQAGQFLTESRKFTSKFSKVQFDLDGLLLLAYAYLNQCRWDVALNIIEEVKAALHDPKVELLVPVTVMYERILFVQAYYEEMMGNHATAGEMYTQCILMNDHFDPQVRLKSLLRIRRLLAIHEFDNLGLEDLIESQQTVHRDIVFLLDYSQRMKPGNTLDRIIVKIKALFNGVLQEEDRVSLILFHSMHRVAFSLAPKSQNTEFIAKNISRWTKPTNAVESALYEGMVTALGEFQGRKQGEYELLSLDSDVLREKVERRTKWVLFVTTSGDTSSNCTVQEVLEGVEQTKANLFGIGVGLRRDDAEKLGELCRARGKGEFWDCEDDREVDEAFRRFAQCISPTSI